MELVGLAMHAKTPKKASSSELSKLTRATLYQKYKFFVETVKRLYFSLTR
ncbi:MAG: hypothetical protein QXP04_00145 [Candidatus Nanoarchaeia archaeon]|nr:hypothetical protein [Candidatus Jingweiarchaeum tengchongense]